VVARWDKALNQRRMSRILNGETVEEADQPEDALLEDVRAAR
jgi:aerobic C4-dicarboxylate transport protein